MSSPESTQSPSADMDQDDKPRVLVDGPGGAETKQGAKIACLECRSAKIKCSAPTDGQVPCKRCVKHQKECLFEKHKRGRKPNKRFSVPSDLRAAARRSSEGTSFEHTNRPTSSGGRSDSHHTMSHHNNEQRQRNSRNGRGTPDRAPHTHQSTFGPNQGSAASRQHFGDANWKQGSGFGPPAQSRGLQPSHYPDDRLHSTADKYPNGGMSTSMSAPSTLAQSSMPYGYPQSMHHAAPLHPQPHSHQAQHHQHQHQFSHQHQHSHQQHQHQHQHQPSQQPSSYSQGRHGSDQPSPGRWRDHPQSQAVSSPHSSHSGAAAAKQHDGFTHAHNRPYSHNALAPSHSYAHWDSQLGSERNHKARLELSPSRRTDASALQGQQQHKASNSISQYATHTDNTKPQKLQSSNSQRSSSKGRVQRRDGLPSSQHQHSSSRSGAYDHEAEEDFEDEQDELEDDADATREEHDYVLSNPLKLLAQASDAAAARIEGGRVEPGSRSSLAAVETMGFLQPTLPSNRMAVSAAVNLTGLGRPLYGRREDDLARAQRGWPSNRVLPPLLNPNRAALPSDEASPDASARSQPAFLRDTMRSKSFPEGELPRLDPPIPLDEHESGAVAAAASSSSQASAAKATLGAPLGRSNVLTPSTLDHEAWEYREGKAQARRGYGSSPGGVSGDAVTTGSSVSAGATTGQKQGAVSAVNGASPGEMIESPADEVTTAMLGKRKRGRSRAARGGGFPTRRRRLAEWDTDAENGDGVDEEGIPDTAKGKQVTIAAIASRKDAGGVTSGGEGEAGASRKGYFNLSLFHSKNDDTEGLDPVELGLVELKELERLFDVFFARINPVLDLFDPFLHSVAFVRMRSAFLTTVISCMAARFSDTPQDAKLASTLDRHWQEKLLPMILLGGHKSVEISQAFLILTTYSRPTNRLVDDRSWQYLGFAIRTATEVGVNRKVTPSENLLGNEQVARRVRNRERLWYNLFLYDRTLSAQTGRPWTISEDRMIVQSSMWHRQDFALPEDVSLVSLIKLRRITAQHTEAFDTYLTSPDRFDETQTATALGVGGQSMFDRRLAGLEFFRKNANADLEKWKETWCINTEDKIKEVDTSAAAGKYLVRWAPTAKLFYYHSRLLINSLVLGSTEQYEGFLSGSSVSVDCWTSAISLIDTVLNDFTEESLVTWSNDRVVMAVYAAVSAVRMTNMQHKYAFADKETLLALVRRLAASMTNAGKTPRHRNGSATPYGRYLKSVLAAFEPENSAASATATTQSGSGATAQTPGKDSEQATSVTTSSLAPGDSRSAAATPTAAMVVAAPPVAGAEGLTQVTLDEHGAKKDDGAGGVTSQADSAAGATKEQSVGGTVKDGSSTNVVLKTEGSAGGGDVASSLAQVPLIVADGDSMDIDISAAASQLAAAETGLDAPSSMEKLLTQMPIDGTVEVTDAGAMLTPVGGTNANNVAWPVDISRPASSAQSSSAGGADGTNLLVAPASNLLLATPISPVALGASEATSAEAGVDAVAAAVAAAGMPDVVDDPESLERMWNYMTSFEHTSFWQPQSTWNSSGLGSNGGGQGHAGGNGP
ncbi:Zn(2)-C6 fungal-type domain-containing protein [Pseudozyma hubeiensis]|nr:Zn(2)-C6 fungal-type domain-containing protein [Pseudozyma hubeiensis]